MLSERMQIQAIADRLAGFETTARTMDFKGPWQACWRNMDKAKPGEEQNALQEALAGFPDAEGNLQKILATRPGYQPKILSLAEIAKDLSAIEWVWKGKIARGFLTVLGASQGSGKSFVAMDFAWRIIHNIGF
ncbi:MAG: hypothetical protein DRI32_05550, partial [Chloroflexi bacterium]